MPYCADGDLLITSDLPLPQGVNRSSYVQMAADEIDMMISRYYKTPVVFNTAELQEKFKPTLLLLKHVNIKLATGRIILAVDAAGENQQVHAYGASLVAEAMRLLEAIVNRDIILEGADGNSNEPSEIATARAIVYQLDATSGVEDFYAMTQNDFSNLLTPYGVTGG
jgi:hypothetical protein